MAEQEGKGTDSSVSVPVKRPKKKRPTYFFLNGKLHKSLHISRGTDVITAWSYPDHKRVGYTYSDVRRTAGKAFTTVEAGKMLNRKRLVLEHAIMDGNINPPQMTYGIDENENRYKYMWSEDNIMEMHAFLSTVHKGHPRNDGMITPMKMPTARELRAMIRQNEILYVKQGDKFVPTFQAEDF